MVEDICPYVFCTKCKSANSWVRHKAKDVIRERDSEVMWKCWKCKYCEGMTLEPAELVKGSVGVISNG